jgi:hypothetical protein
VFDIQFLSRKPFHHHKRGGMQRHGGYWLSNICLVFRSRFRLLDWLVRWWPAAECIRACTCKKNMFCNHPFWR